MSEALTAAALRARFTRVVVPRYIEIQAGTPQESPRFVSVGGQPGAGKGGVIDTVRRTIPGSVVVNGDELRQFHPEYFRLMNEDPLRMPEVTQSASGPWVGMSTEYLREHRLSAIVETTLRNAPMLGAEFEAFRAAGYTTELRVVAVPLEVSRAGTLSRYVEQVKDFGAGRWTLGAAHDEAAANVTETVRTLVATGLVDHVVVQNRDGHIFHEADARGGGAVHANAAAQSVDLAREVHTLTEAQAQGWLGDTAEALRDRIRLKQHDPDLANVAHRLATIDAAAVVPRAYPGDPSAQHEALATLAAAHRPPPA